MKAAAITFLVFALPASAGAQALTLNCQVESSYEPMKAGSETPATGSFSAIVRINEVPGVARIEATTFGCFVYVGGFDEQEVAGDCERVAAGTKIKATLTINRINGEFSHTTLIGQSYTIYNGHCAVAKKLF
jgi:hypothetical protein